MTLPNILISQLHRKFIWFHRISIAGNTHNVGIGAYNFAEFLARSRKKCRTKDDFIAKTLREIKLVNESPVNQQFKSLRQVYLERLEGAKFAAITNQYMESDKYNDELMDLLESLA